jgi:hypothetical protein
VRFVSAESDALARKMERRLAALPAQAGILFVSVTAQPTDDGEVKEFVVRLGIARHLQEGTGRALISKYLAEEMRAGLKVFAGIYRGVPGASGDDSSPTTRPTAS